MRGKTGPMHTAAEGSAPAPTRTHRHGWWWKALLIGLGLWGVTIAVTAITGNTNLIPTLILVGGFLVPFCVVLFVAERLRGNMTVTGLIAVFFLSGLFGVLGASLLETTFTASLWSFLLIAAVEETIKAIILIVAGWRYIPKTASQGALLGAVVGAGFAAFESTGYAFNAAITAAGIDLLALLETEVIRAVLAPVGHVLWTAIVGAAIFGAARSAGRYRVTVGAIGALVAVIALHAAWDAMGLMAEYAALALTGNLATVARTGTLPSDAISAVTGLADALYVVGLVVVTAAGILLVAWIIRAHRATRPPTDSSASADQQAGVTEATEDR